MTLVGLPQLKLAQGHKVLALLCKHNIYLKEPHLGFNFLHWRFTFLLLKIKKNPKKVAVVVKLLELLRIKI